MLSRVREKPSRLNRCGSASLLKLGKQDPKIATTSPLRNHEYTCQPWCKVRSFFQILPCHGDRTHGFVTLKQNERLRRAYLGDTFSIDRFGLLKRPP